MFLLLCRFLNWLVSFIKKRLNTIQIMVLRRQYQPVAQDGKEEDSSTWTTDRGDCEPSRSNAMAGSLD